MAASHARPESPVPSPIGNRPFAGPPALAFGAVLKRLSDTLNFLNLFGRTRRSRFFVVSLTRARARVPARYPLTFLTFVRIRTLRLLSRPFAQSRVSGLSRSRARSVGYSCFRGG